jgi:hypothetical protein
MGKTAIERKGIMSRLKKMRDIDREENTEDPINESGSDSELLLEDDLIEESGSESDKRDANGSDGDEEEDAIEDDEEEYIQMSGIMRKDTSDDEIDDGDQEEEEEEKKEKVYFFKNIGALTCSPSLLSKSKEENTRSPPTKSKKPKEKKEVEEKKGVKRKRSRKAKVSPETTLPIVISEDDVSEPSVPNPLLAAYLKRCFDNEAVLDSGDENANGKDEMGIDCDGGGDDEDDEDDEDEEEDETLGGFVVNDLDETERDDERSPSSKARCAYLLEDDRDKETMSKEMVIYEDKIRAFVADYKYIIGLTGVTETGVAERNLQPHLGKLCNDPLYSEYQKLQTLHGLLLKDLLKLWQCYDKFRTQQDITRKIIKRSMPSDSEEELDAVLEGLGQRNGNGRKRSNIIKD